MHASQHVAEADVSWLAIRQPAVMRLLERELGCSDALAAGLELACQVLGGRTSLGDLRLDHRALTHGLAAVRDGHCDRAMVRSLRDRIYELENLVLTKAEEDAVATVVAAVVWAVLDASVRDLADTLVA